MTVPKAVGCNPPKKFCVKTFITARWYFRALLSCAKDGAFEDSPKAKPRRSVHHDNSVTGAQPQFERAAVVSVHDPFGLFDESFNGRHPLQGWHFVPPRAPVDCVKVDKRKASCFSQAPRERRFARSTRTNNEHFFIGFDGQSHFFGPAVGIRRCTCSRSLEASQLHRSHAHSYGHARKTTLLLTRALRTSQARRRDVRSCRAPKLRSTKQRSPATLRRQRLWHRLDLTGS